MSDLGQWVFEQQKKKLLEAIDVRMPRTGIVQSTASTGVTITDPLTGVTESELLVPAGFRPEVGTRALIVPLSDGSRVAIPLGSTTAVYRDAQTLIKTDGSSGLALISASGNLRFRVDGAANEVQVASGVPLVFYQNASSGPSGEIGRIASATGLITGLYMANAAQRGIYLDIRQDATPTTATNASASTYVEHAATTIALPTGTWTITAFAWANYKNNTANDGARCVTDIDGSAGTESADTTATANALFMLASGVSVTGKTGSCNLRTRYKAETGGTVTARDIWWYFIAERTA